MPADALAAGLADDGPGWMSAAAATAYAQAVGVYLGFATIRHKQRQQQPGRWNGVGEKAQHFGRQRSRCFGTLQKQ